MIKYWTESVLYEKLTLSRRYCETTNSCINMHYSILLPDVDLSKMPYNAIGFLLIHFSEAPSFHKDKDLTSYLYFLPSYKIWVFFFLNTSHPFLETADFLLPFTGLLQNFYNSIDYSSFKSNGSSLPLIRFQLTQG